jgi:ribosomal protein L32E
MAHFQRTKHYAYAKLGSKQKSKRRYKRSDGRHNKTRQKWKSRPPRVEVGYKNQVNTRNIINGKLPVVIYNLADLRKVGKDNIAIIGKIGGKSKLEIAREIISKKIETLNFNAKKFIKQFERLVKMKNLDKSKTENKK